MVEQRVCGVAMTWNGAPKELGALGIGSLTLAYGDA